MIKLHKYLEGTYLSAYHNTLTLKSQDHMSSTTMVLTLIIKTLLMHFITQLNNASWMPKFKLYKWF